jgi:dipeptidyl aminopeptidase/acylaminoacyl peptidase
MDWFPDALRPRRSRLRGSGLLAPNYISVISVRTSACDRFTAHPDGCRVRVHDGSRCTGGGEALALTTNTSVLTADLIVAGAAPRQPVISPDGQWVAYVVAPVGRPGEQRLSTLWLASADGSSPPRRLTAGTAADSGPRWTPDSAALFFMSDRTGSDQLHRIRIDGGEAESLTDWRGDIHDFCPLADGRVALVAADEPTEEDERRRAERDDAMVWSEQRGRGRLRLLDPATCELHAAADLGGRHVVELAQRPDGGALAALSWVSEEIDPGAITNELHVVDLASGTVLDLGRVCGHARSLAWWADAGPWHLSYLAEPDPFGGFAAYDIVPGPAATPRDLTIGMDVCPAELAQVDGGPPLALFASGLDTEIRQLDPAALRFRCLSGRPGLLGTLTASGPGDVVAVLASTADQPADVHAGPPAGPLRRISDTRPELREIQWGTQERLAYQAADGQPLDGLLIRPAGRSRADGPFPLVTLVHGGPDDRYADEFRLGAHSPGQWLATAGYAVFLPNPRGGTGHGREFAAAVVNAVGGDEWGDILAGIDMLVAAGVADPDRLGIGGDSHGGFMAAWAVGQTDRFKAALMFAGISDWGAQAGVGEYGTMDGALAGSFGWEGTGPHPHDRVSPVSFASRVRTPVLIVHGEDDTNVPVGQAIYFHRALTRYGAEHELVIYPREGHGLSERNHQRDLLLRTRAWFDRWLRDRVSP